MIVLLRQGGRCFWRSPLIVIALLLALAFPHTAKGQGKRPQGQTPAPPPATRPSSAAAQRLRVQLLATYPHDPTAFTQGLELHAGMLYESTGLYGRSSLRQVDLASGAVFRRLDLPATLFGEGLTRVDDHLVQLTWQGHVALIYDLATFAKIGELSYPSEGWGLVVIPGLINLSSPRRRGSRHYEIILCLHSRK